MPQKYTVNAHLVGAFDSDNPTRRVFSPGDIVKESDLRDAGFKDIARLHTPDKPGFPPHIVPIRGTEDDSPVGIGSATDPVLTGGALDLAPRAGGEGPNPADLGVAPKDAPGTGDGGKVK